MSGYPGVRPAESFRILEREEAFRGRVVAVSVDRIVLPGGHETRHEVLHLPPAVCVVPLLEGPPGRWEVLLVEQFRNALEGYLFELPAGILEQGEDPAACAARELEEETGFRARRIAHLATLFPIPGTSAHRMHFYLAEDLEPGTQRLEASECLTVRRAPLDELAAKVLEGTGGPSAGGIQIVDAKTTIGILRAAVLKGALPARELGRPARP
ncbi:MAG: NUDIX hydrolase [Planctomycetota bacterium]